MTAGRRLMILYLTRTGRISAITSLRKRDAFPTVPVNGSLMMPRINSTVSSGTENGDVLEQRRSGLNAAPHCIY